METLEVHYKDFLIKWVTANDHSIIDWQVKPLKKSINFAIYKKSDLVESDDTLASGTPASGGPGRYRSTSVNSVNNITEPIYKTKSRASTLSSNISNGDLNLIKNYNKLVGGELVRGKLDVEKGGTFAFIFDNSFSKTVNKKVLFSSSIHTQQTQFAADYPTPAPDHVHPASGNIMRPKNGEILQSILLKKRKKKLQGFVKRYFVLNFKYGTLSYFQVNDFKLRGQMPIKECVISANAKKLEIIIDSGMEAWDLKALNENDFNTWIDAFNSVGKSYDYDYGSATFHKDLRPDSEKGLPGFLFDDLNLLKSNVTKLSNDADPKLQDNLAFITKDINNLLSKLNNHISAPAGLHDSMSLFSSNDFYDAKDYLGETSEGVIAFNGSDDDGYSSIEEEDDDLDSSSEPSTYSTDKDMPIIEETISSSTVDDKDNTLYPLPLEAVERSSVIPEWTHPPPSILSFVRKNVGKDLSSIAMPVDINEPLTILQKYAEIIEYSDLINNALQVDDDPSSGEMILRVAAFAVSSMSSVREKERNNRKPFNPLLGETYELVREDKGLRLVSEKVCHKPAVFAIFVEAEDWALTFSPSPSQKFWGKTSEIITNGTVKLTTKSTGEVFQWSQPKTLLKNIIAGEKYSEPVGQMIIKSSTGAKAVVTFEKAGMFSGRSENLTIAAFDSNKKELPYTVTGKWTESLVLKTNSTEKVIWEVGELLPNAKKRFGFTKFASELNLITPIEEGKIAPTDSRLRPDLQTYLKEDITKAEELKLELEENQRVRRKQFEASSKKYKPLFFHHISKSDAPDSGEWIYNRGEKSYWNRRKNSDWDDLIKLW